MRITFTVPESKELQTGVIIKTYEVGKYLVREDKPTHGQPDTRFVFGPQVREVK